MHSVAVVTDPPIGPHPIGSTVNLTCLIHPQPPGGRSTYQWRDYLQYTYLAVANSSLSYATTLYWEMDTLTQQDTTVRCTTGINCLPQEVLSSPYNVGYSMHVISTYVYDTLLYHAVGLLSPVGPTTVQYNTSDTVILRVNITPTATFTKRLPTSSHMVLQWD